MNIYQNNQENNEVEDEITRVSDQEQITYEDVHSITNEGEDPITNRKEDQITNDEEGQKEREEENSELCANETTSQQVQETGSIDSLQIDKTTSASLSNSSNSENIQPQRSLITLGTVNFLN